MAFINEKNMRETDFIDINNSKMLQTDVIKVEWEWINKKMGRGEKGRNKVIRVACTTLSEIYRYIINCYTFQGMRVWITTVIYTLGIQINGGWYIYQILIKKGWGAHSLLEQY